MVRILPLETDYVSLIYAIDENSRLYQMHFGKALHSSDEVELRLKRSASYSGDQGYPVFDCSTFPITLNKGDKQLDLSFLVYDYHNSVNGDRKETTIFLKADSENILLELSFYVYKKSGVIETTSTIINQTDECLTYQ